MFSYTVFQSEKITKKTMSKQKWFIVAGEGGGGVRVRPGSSQVSVRIK